jgi:hypothetical protein
MVKVHGSGLKAKVVGFRVECVGFKVEGAGLRVQGVDSRVEAETWSSSTPSGGRKTPTVEGITWCRVEGLGFRG